MIKTKKWDNKVIHSMHIAQCIVENENQIESTNKGANL